MALTEGFMSSETSSGSSSSKALLWMTIGLFAGMGVLLIGGFFTAKRVLTSVSLGALVGNRNNMAMPHGKLRLEKPDQIGPGLPVYPTASMEMPDNSAQTLKDVETGVDVAHYHSPDYRGAVDLWYHDHLGSEFNRYDATQQVIPEELRDPHVGDSDLFYVAERGGQKGLVVLRMDDNGTTISLIRISKTEPGADSASNSNGTPADAKAGAAASPVSSGAGNPAPAPSATPNN